MPDDVRDDAGWLLGLTGDGADLDAAVADLHGLLLRGALSEAGRRSGRHGISGRELEDLAHQAADDAVVSVLRRVEEFRGDSRFTTWAYKFVILEVASKIGRHVWRRDGVSFDEGAWEALPERMGHGPDSIAESRELAQALRDGVETVLTVHQRRVFVAIVLNGSPLDAVVVELDTNRNAIYKTLFDARKKLRRFLEERELLEP